MAKFSISSDVFLDSAGSSDVVVNTALLTQLDMTFQFVGFQSEK